MYLRKILSVIVLIILMVNVISVLGIQYPIKQYKREEELQPIIINGQYIGLYTLEFSGRYARKYSIKYSINTISRLSITYIFNYTLIIGIDSIVYKYKYKLIDYYISSTNIRKSFIEAINTSLSKIVNKEFYGSSSIIDPYIVLRIRGNTTLFKKVGFKGITSGITIFDDVYSFELKHFYTYSVENFSSTRIITQYREVLTYTPLYYYMLTYNSSNYGYIREKVSITNYNIGIELSKTIVTNSSFFQYGYPSRIGKFAFISLNTSSTEIYMRIKMINTTLHAYINDHAPYRIMLLLDSRTHINYSNIPLTKYNATTTVLYVSKIYHQPLNITINLTREPIKPLQEANQVGMKGLTIEEREPLTLSDLLVIIAVNTVLILTLFEIIRFLYKRIEVVTE
jgi:hypothetical protein